MGVPSGDGGGNYVVVSGIGVRGGRRGDEVVRSF